MGTAFYRFTNLKEIKNALKNTFLNLVVRPKLFF